jgi:hypothetical protein
MNRHLNKMARFVWRVSRNVVCALPGGTRLLFPANQLAQHFGRDDVDYAITVFLHHARQLAASGFGGGEVVFEAGPGRNLGSALLWWCRGVAEGYANPSVLLWDVHTNANPAATDFWQTLAQALLPVATTAAAAHPEISAPQLTVLQQVADGAHQPNIRYLVCPLEALQANLGAQKFELMLSHAALEHVRMIEIFWKVATGLTAENGWHSHRIDLADHGRRETNYIEMLEWSDWAWWATMRFIPGAINRWRASEYLAVLQNHGLAIKSAVPELRVALPVPRYALAARYRSLREEDLRTTAIDIVAKKVPSQCAC